MNVVDEILTSYKVMQQIAFRVLYNKEANQNRTRSHQYWRVLRAYELLQRHGVKVNILSGQRKGLGIGGRKESLFVLNILYGKGVRSVHRVYMSVPDSSYTRCRTRGTVLDSRCSTRAGM